MKLFVVLSIVLALTACQDQPNVNENENNTLSLRDQADASYQPDAASRSTQLHQQQWQQKLPVGDFLDGSLMSQHSKEQRIAALPKDIAAIRTGDFLFTNEQPDTINPSLFSYMQQDLQDTGLFKISEGVYQIRGDLADVTLVRGNSGWILIDAGVTKTFTEKAWQAFHSVLPGGTEVPITSIILSHSHIDHFGGIKGFVSQQQVDDGQVSVIAPYGFMEEVLAENIIVGSAMQRRAHYHFGFTLDTRQDGRERFYFPLVKGDYSLIQPTEILPQNKSHIETRVIDGVTIQFKDISGAEAPASTLMYFPEHNMLYNSELMYRGQHNIYALRGAKVRDALAWSKLINEVIVKWGDKVELMTGPHGPTFSGNEKINEFMEIQRDNYGFIHNQTVRLINSGVKLQDVGHRIEAMVPQSLTKVWHTHGFHGSYSHNARGVANRYLGFYDGNPAYLNPLPSVDEATLFIRYMGGEESVFTQLKQDYQQGKYQEVATIANKLVTVNPDHWPARHLLAKAYEQLAFQAENPQWRNAYLAAAKELRLGEIQVPDMQIKLDDLLQAATVENILDSLAVRINGVDAADERLAFNLRVTDTDEIFFVQLSNGNLNYARVDKSKDTSLTLTIKRQDLIRLLSKNMSATQILSFAYEAISGSPLPLITLITLIEKDQPFYPLVPMPED
ncbi:alkyl/aryl-sulfatase [Thalassotalea litorea]|uniref:alkyl/aryl-sulfatase n=1 Tax=Thalassotalea litorea TaxID=2020715 RepID=UPI00373629F0